MPDYYCQTCGRRHKSGSKIWEEHLVEGDNLDIVEPGAEEVTPDGNAGEDLNSPLESSPGESPERLLGVAESNSPPDEPPSPEEFGAWIVKQIGTLNENQQAIHSELAKLQSNQYEAVSTAEAGPDWNIDWEKIPEDIRKAGLKFIGDLGAAARGLAGAAPTEMSVDERIIREAVKLTRDQVDGYVASKAANIARAMADPNLSVFVGPSEEEP